MLSRKKVSLFSTREESPLVETTRGKKHPIQALETTLSSGLDAEIKRQTLCSDSVEQQWNKYMHD